ncbi:MAG: class I SAM-dependent rRNA methyltransferase [Thermodesulfobacteriota bacterium]
MALPRQTKSVILKPGREKTIRNRHPWIFSGAIERVEGSPACGETVAIRTHDGNECGCGAFSPRSQIAVRIWSFQPGEDVSEAFFRTRLERAVAFRRHIFTEAAGIFGRLVYAESDGLPGLVVDCYGEYLVCQFLSAGAEYWKKTLRDILWDLFPVKGIYERSDVAVRDKEGLPQISGALKGPEPPDLIEITEGPCRFLADVKQGHKTGFYFDQRENRRSAAAYLKHADVLDCFAYTGGFSIAALKGGAAAVTVVDSSAKALALAGRNIALNHLDESAIFMEEGDVFTSLRRYAEIGRSFEAVILDPPKFALSVRDVKKAMRAYKDINMAALKLLKSGGVLITFSCSHHVGSDLFQKAVAYAALDARRDVQIIQRLHQAADHPVSLNFPEGEYLKGLICRVG